MGTAAADITTTAADATTAASLAATTAAETTTAAEPADGRQRGPDGKFLPKETVAAKPVEYAIVLPKDSTLDASAIERTTAIARELGLSDTAAAQKVLDLVHEQTTAQRTALLAAHQPGGAEWEKNVQKVVTAQHAQWKAETDADVSLGKTPEERKAAIDLGGTVIKAFKVANPEMGTAIDTFLDTSGVGNRRELAHFLAWLGKSAGERSMVTGNDASVQSESAILDAMYPSMRKT